MTSWVHLFSKFSSEALLFEALLLCLGVAAYSGWVILKKRREILAEEQIPGSVVKVYLAELITEAEQMRAQLHGLLKAAGGSAPEANAALLASTMASHGVAATSRAAPTAAGAAADPALLERMHAMEARMREQSQAMEQLISEKTRIERELISAKSAANAPASTGDASGEGDESAELRRKIQGLEAKLAEYSVIEDDLANLKRLQQENAQLRGQLAQSSGPQKVDLAAMAQAATPAAAPAAAAPAAPAEAASQEPVSAVAMPTLEPSLTAEAAPSFDQLAQQVDQSLAAAPAPAQAEPAPAAEPPKEEPKKSESDLLAEFEKMLNG